MISSNKRTQTAYERWELASLDQESVAQPAEDSVQSAADKQAEELAAIKDQAYQNGLKEGHTTGYEEGRTLGYEDGLNEGKQQALAEGRETNELIGQQLSELISLFESDARQARENIAQQLLLLCLDMTQAMLKTALSIKPELILPIIEQSLHTLPCLQLPATLHLNPDDFALVEQALGDSLKENGWRLISDNQIEAGGCHIETGTNQIDATLPSRWQQLQQTLGQNTDWLASH